MSNPQVNGISPWMAGASSPGWKFTLTQGTDSILDLTGVTTGQLSLYIYSITNASSSNPTYTKIATGLGPFTIATPATSGIVSYVPLAADSATLLGAYAIRVVVNFGGTNLYATDYIPWTIQS